MDDFYRPADLPPIDDVEVVPVPPGGLAKASRIHRRMRFEGTVALRGDAAQEIAALWRALPDYDLITMCHYPPFVLRFFAADRVVLSASLCWECHNAVGTTPAGPFTALFDGDSEIARELLARLDEISPGRTTT